MRPRQAAPGARPAASPCRQAPPRCPRCQTPAATPPVRKDARSTVVVDPADSKVLIIRSSLCDDDDVQAVVSTAQGELRANGITAVRCLAAHDGVIFEKTF